ncbi:MAG: pilus assembly protein PilN [Gammaproteobacteria bacterium]|nr:MAG: pilus assembly protein PilN [Gammaproteobacteria bacterium]
MVNINLLPWRERLRAQRKREFGMLVLLAVILTGAALGYWHWYNEQLIDFQQERNRYLKNEIAKVDKQIREIRDLEKIRRQLISRMKVVAELQSQRPLVVHLFDELVATLPDGVYLNSVVQKGRSVTVEGKAESNARISAYMRNIEASPWLSNPQLRIIQQKGGGNDSPTFSLTMQQVVPKAEDEQ